MLTHLDKWWPAFLCNQRRIQVSGKPTLLEPVEKVIYFNGVFQVPNI